MQAAYGAASPLPATGSPGVSAPSAIPKHQRYSSSRSNSFSSASIVTVKRTASLSSSGRGSAVAMRAQSPGDTSVIALRLGRDQLSQDQKRRQSVAIDSVERPNSDGVGHLHRYSTSTGSSVASGTNTRRNRASSGALVAGAAIQSFSPKKRGAGTIDYSPRTSVQRPPISRSSSQGRRSPVSSQERERLRPTRPDLNGPLYSLPSIQATPALNDTNEESSSIQTLGTPYTQSSHGPDYLVRGEMLPQPIPDSQKPPISRCHTAPVSAMESLPAQAIGGAQQTTAASVDREHDIGEASTTKLEHRSDELESQSIKPLSGKEKKARTRERGEKDKKAMLARALQQANTAVLLDNAQNFEGALEAYTDACKLLQQVTERSTGQDDKRKLNAIKYTYTTRIEELRQMVPMQPETNTIEKSLPARPTSDESIARNPALASPTIDSTIQESDGLSNVQPTGMLRPSHPWREDDTLSATETRSAAIEPQVASGTQYNLMPDEPDFEQAQGEARAEISGHLDMNKNVNAIKSPTSAVSDVRTKILRISPPRNDEYLPAPLSPSRGLSPQSRYASQPTWSDDLDLMPSNDKVKQQQQHHDGVAAASWLDTIDEHSSRASSVHSISSQQGLRRKYLRAVSGVSSNADFDAAFDAAVEAAYDQGLEPDVEAVHARDRAAKKRQTNDSIPTRSSDIAEIETSGVKSRLYGHYSHHIEEDDDDDDRMMDDLAQDYEQSFKFDVSSKSALPRQSGSSGYSRSTWQSSQLSDRTTAGTSLSTVAEDVVPATGSKNAFATSPLLNNALTEPMPPPPPPLTAPPPQVALPKPPVVQNRTSSVRNRRLSGPHMKQLKIETPGTTEARKRDSTVQVSSPVKGRDKQQRGPSADFDFGTSFQSSDGANTRAEHELKSSPSFEPSSALLATYSADPTIGSTLERSQSPEDEIGELRTYQPTFVKKNRSADGLREHTVLLASPATESGPSLYTPLSSTFMNFSSKRMNETPLISQRARGPASGSPSIGTGYEGVVMFDTSLSDGQSPASPKSPAIPLGVEPCPESSLLRPFWLMRNILSTLTHAKGGFLTSRLFVPREVWQIQSAKIKNVEDKVANCDSLAAALARLASVDTYDADAVMEELESFEDVLERIQNNLSKKLGNEVGTGGLAPMFKGASAGTATQQVPSFGTDTNAGSDKMKGYLTSWKKLRQKGSAAPSAALNASKTSAKNAEKRGLEMSTVPMTDFISLDRRGMKKDVRHMVFEGPNKDYMGSLARLFEGAQVLDQIARQVEDPGLRGTSQTHVGLELSIRHAAEFFSFYICRFVLADMNVLIDKFLKRGTEWVLT